MKKMVENGKKLLKSIEQITGTISRSGSSFDALLLLKLWLDDVFRRDLGLGDTCWWALDCLVLNLLQVLGWLIFLGLALANVIKFWGLRRLIFGIGLGCLLLGQFLFPLLVILSEVAGLAKAVWVVNFIGVLASWGHLLLALPVQSNLLSMFAVVTGILSSHLTNQSWLNLSG